MRLRIVSAALAALALVTTSCSENDITGPQSSLSSVTPHFTLAVAQPVVRISEFHYDNFGIDANERVEVSGPAGMDLTGWKIVLYNGSGGPVYSTTTLSGAIPANCGARGTVTTTYPSNGIQNGDPDGIALVDGSGAVVEFLSYGGSFAGVGGAAAGVMSRNIGIKEVAAPVGQSLWRDADGTWNGPSVSPTCNDDQASLPAVVVASVTVLPISGTIIQGATQQFTGAAKNSTNAAIPGAMLTWTSTDPTIASVDVNGLAKGLLPGDTKIIALSTNGLADTSALHVNAAPPPSGLPATRFSELHYDNTGVDADEAIELEGPAGTDLTGWSIVLYNGNDGKVYDTKTLTGTVPATCDTRGVAVINYAAGGIQNGSPDGMALIDNTGRVVEFLSYEGTMTAADGPALGLLSTDIVRSENSAAIGRSLQRDATGAWVGPTASSFGACNPAPPPPPAMIFTGRDASSPALPVGFQDQLFATVLDSNGNAVGTTVTWSSDTPGILTIDANGVMTAQTAGTGVIRATAPDGVTTATYRVATRVAVASATAIYAGNTEFGEPTDSDPSDDYILRHTEYTSSYNKNRGTPNWVSYDLEATHFGTEDRCDCFTFDPELPAAFTHYDTNDYTGAAAINGFRIDRGHLARSFDRTSASLDNAFTFLFSNIVPQASELNQGSWADMENYLGDFARLQNKEVYIIAGVAGSRGTLKNEGKVVIPAEVWKVAVIMPRDKGLADVRSINDLQVIATIFPNEASAGSEDWTTFKTTVDAVEALSGYDLLALLPDPIEIAVESNTKPPVAAADGPYASNEGASVSLSAAGSSDPDGDELTYAWDFGDGTTGTGVSASHTYTQDGLYTVQLIATDIRGLSDTVSTTATVSNVAPSIGAFAGATLLPGETYSASGSFTDPGADTWTGSVDYGAGAGVVALSLSSKNFSLSNTYNAAGTFTVTVGIADDHVTSTRAATVTVLSPSQGVDQALALVQQLIDAGKVNAGNGNSLKSKLQAALNSLSGGQTSAAAGQLGALLNELDAMERSGRLSAADAAALRTMVTRVLASIN